MGARSGKIEKTMIKHNMKKKEIIIAIISLLLGASLMYWYFGKELEFKNEARTPAIEVVSTQAKNQEIPECFAGRCPQYLSMTVDKDSDGFDASVVIIPTAMTQGAGKIEIIKNGRVIFESSEMANIGVERVEDGDGFILTYSSPRDENFNNVKYSVRYRFKEGKFVADNI